MELNYIPAEYGTTFGVPDLDYLTITSFNQDLITSLNQYVDYDSRVADVFRQYTGYRVGQLRVLSGEQSSRLHYMVIAEGSAANWLMRYVTYEPDHRGYPLCESCNCTRIDMQVSARNDSLDLRDVKDLLVGAVWNRRGKAPHINLVEGQKTERGLGKTVYIGSRKSKNGSFVRIYEKPDHAGMRWLRFEAQFKGRTAKSIFDAGTRDIGSMLGHLVRRFEMFPDSFKRLFKGHSDAMRGLSPEKLIQPNERVTEPQRKRFEWFDRHVAPALSDITDIDVLKDLEESIVKLLIVTKNRLHRQMDLRERQEAMLEGLCRNDDPYVGALDSEYGMMWAAVEDMIRCEYAKKTVVWTQMAFEFLDHVSEAHADVYGTHADAYEDITRSFGVRFSRK